MSGVDGGRYRRRSGRNEPSPVDVTAVAVIVATVALVLATGVEAVNERVHAAVDRDRADVDPADDHRVRADPKAPADGPADHVDEEDRGDDDDDRVVDGHKDVLDRVDYRLERVVQLLFEFLDVYT